MLSGGTEDTHLLKVSLNTILILWLLDTSYFCYLVATSTDQMLTLLAFLLQSCSCIGVPLPSAKHLVKDTVTLVIFRLEAVQLSAYLQ